MTEVQVVVALGSNLGDRREHLREGVRRLGAFLRVDRVSRVMETPPWGDQDQGPFLNVVLVGRTHRSPREIMEALLEVERARGRVRVRSGGPRTLDADLIFHGQSVLDEPGLVLPHPRWHTRTFVALPLLELLPDGVDPVTGLPLAERVKEEVFREPHRDAGPLEGWAGEDDSLPGLPSGAETVWVRTGEGGSYPVITGVGVLASLPELLAARAPAHSYAVVTDSTVDGLYGERVLELLSATGARSARFPFPAGERHKTRAEWNRLTDALLDWGMGRDGCVVALGGGVTGDLAGFVAATYMRGVPVVQIPTSLVAMIDASVGGKTGVDVPAGKNLVGAFHPPRFVLADTELAQTLPPRERAQGLVEAMKHGAIRDRAYLDALCQEAGALMAGAPDVTVSAIRRSVEIKAEVVSLDEREGGIREILNFGHTLGHALELRSSFRLPHGSAVAAGMILEALLGERLGITESGSWKGLRGALQGLELDSDPGAGLSAVAGPLLRDTEALTDATRLDKKARGGSTRYVLLARLGEVARSPGWSHHVPPGAVADRLSQLPSDLFQPGGRRV